MSARETPPSHHVSPRYHRAEAVYLMELAVRRIPQTSAHERKKSLLQEQIRHYRARYVRVANFSLSTKLCFSPFFSCITQRAAELMADESSTMPKSVFLESDEIEKPVIEPMSSPRSVQSDEVDSVASQANAKLSQALDLDEEGKAPEAVEAYMAAAEIYLEALKLAEQHTSTSSRMETVATVLKRRLESTFDRVTELKQSQSSNKIVEKTSKNRSVSPVPASSTSTSALTQEEISVLMRSSTIASKLFLPWSENDAIQLSKEAQSGGKSLYKDPDGFLPLNPKQKPRFRHWARPSDICRLREKLRIARSQTPELVRSITPYSIKQQYVTDCSFIASLCICAAYERRFKKRLVTSIIYPQSKNGSPMLSPEGKYMVKLWLNGVARCVIVDDYLPIDEYGNLLCSQTSSPSGPYLELWVCIIEKAYMKLCGGYDFPGSNSGVDLFSITGWIPERIHFAKNENRVRDHETPPQRAWDRIASASCYGDCLITVSSQLELSNKDTDDLGLVTGHAYAVLSVMETRRGVRLLLLKNPWAHKSWKGRYSCHDKASWRDPELRKELGYNPELAAKKDDGVFWISWEDVLRYFRNFHMSWNPTLFAYRATTHGFWPKIQGPLDDTFNVGENPQYVVALSDAALKNQATLWVQISRHVSKQEQEGGEVQDFLTVHIHRTSSLKERVWYPGKSGKCVLTGAYTNSPQMLVRYDIMDPADKYLVLVLSQYQRSSDLSYTLSCYCTENFNFGRTQTDLVNRSDVTGVLNPEGGPIGSSLYSRNTMVALKVPESGASMEFCLGVTKTIALNILIFQTHNYGDGLSKSKSKPVVDSGNYRHGFVATCRQFLPQGSYVAVISPFDPGASAPFKLEMHSSQKIQAKLLS